jgi:hypothetical protein
MKVRQRYMGRHHALIRWAVMDWLIVINWEDVRRANLAQ